jgi:hypothetical protein
MNLIRQLAGLQRGKPHMKLLSCIHQVCGVRVCVYVRTCGCLKRGRMCVCVPYKRMNQAIAVRVLQVSGGGKCVCLQKYRISRLYIHIVRNCKYTDSPSAYLLNIPRIYVLLCFGQLGKYEGPLFSYHDTVHELSFVRAVYVLFGCV